MQYGHQNEPPKKGQSPNDPQNKHTDNRQKQGVNDSKEGRQRQVIGTRHDQEAAYTMRIYLVPSQPLNPACDITKPW
jgi:hypothetical protein